uniref:[RNA-polymerase]-subunit kinase n=1 Tax=Oryza rufipogon TaxID=4529 RepID=A0A0E0QWC3_ORYRU
MASSAVASRKRAAPYDLEPRACCGSSPASGPKRRRYNFGSADDYERLDVDIVRAMMRPLVDAAKKMHASRVIHRDIKPENILVSFSGQLKICDFGAATLMKPAGKPYDLCRPGTLPYTSPEQLAGNRCYGPAVDMWALGCIMGELLTGAPLFGGDMTEEELLADLSANLDDQLNELFYDVLPELSPAAREVLSGLLAFDPEKRLTASEALEHRWFAEEPKKAEFPGFVPLFEIIS